MWWLKTTKYENPKNHILSRHAKRPKCLNISAADWWSLGALMFDMLTGCPPFSADTKRETQDLILRGQIRQPAGVTPEAKNLLKSLLQRNHTTRLGGGEGDALEIQVGKNIPAYS